MLFYYFLTLEKLRSNCEPTFFNFLPMLQFGNLFVRPYVRPSVAFQLNSFVAGVSQFFLPLSVEVSHIFLCRQSFLLAPQLSDFLFRSYPYFSYRAIYMHMSSTFTNYFRTCLVCWASKMDRALRLFQTRSISFRHPVLRHFGLTCLPEWLRFAQYHIHVVPLC